MSFCLHSPRAPVVHRTPALPAWGPLVDFIAGTLWRMGLLFLCVPLWALGLVLVKLGYLLVDFGYMMRDRLELTFT